jgi:hypothetical protein
MTAEFTPEDEVFEPLAIDEVIERGDIYDALKDYEEVDQLQPGVRLEIVAEVEEEEIGNALSRARVMRLAGSAAVIGVGVAMVMARRGFRRKNTENE